MSGGGKGGEAAGNDLGKARFSHWLRHQLGSGAPAAVVRFGDSEARLLTVSPNDAASMNVVGRNLEQQTGLSFSDNDVLEVKMLVAHAFDRADVLGIRFWDRFLAEHKRWMRRLATLYEERVAAGRPPVPLAHCLLGHDVLDMLPGLLAGRPVSVVSCRDLKPVLEADWGLDDVAVYQVPSQYRTRIVDGAYEAAMHDIPIWPDAHARLHASLTVRERGEVFLVGAGMLGKDLCIRIRDRGGIALDMGSALDQVAGKLTRGPRRRLLDFYANGMSADRIVSQVQRLYGTQVSRERVYAEIEAAVSTELTAWQARPLSTPYSMLCCDGLRVDLGDERVSRASTCRLALGLAPEGHWKPLDIWWHDDDDHEAWLTAVADLRDRGLRNPPRISTGDSGGFRKAAEEIHPDAALESMTEPIEPLNGIREAIQRHGRFPDEKAATALVYLASRRLQVATRTAPNRSSRC